MGDVYRQVTYGVYIVRNRQGFREATGRHYGKECNPRQPGGVEATYPCVIHFHGQLQTADCPYFYWFDIEKYRTRLQDQLGKFDNF